MPYPNEHTARIKNPDDFEQDSFIRKNIAMGIDIIVGKLKGKDTTITQAYRFKKDKFTSAEAKKWLKDHDISYISFEPASEKDFGTMEIKGHSGYITETKESDINNIPIGIVKGYIATWDVDSWSDQFVKGAFSEALNDLRQKGKDIPLKKEHNNVIGKFPIETVIEDDKGLYGEANINLDVQEGREYYSLAKQRAINDFSIGYIPQEKEFVDGIRKIKKSKVLEGSMVGNPMNEHSNITEVKSRDMFPSKFADKSKIIKMSNIEHDNAYLFERKMQIADMVDGELTIIPSALISARVEMIKGIEGITEQENEKIRNTINSLYKEMGFREPFENGKSRGLNKTEIKSIKISMLSDILKKTFSSDTSDYIAGLIHSQKGDDISIEILHDLSEMLKSTQEKLK